jgi:dihydrofolate reductase
MISIVVAQARNRVIGKSSDLPWYLPADLKHFKDLTTGHAVIMGRKTHDSIFARLGKPLPNRANIVVTHQEDFAPKGVIVAHSVEEALGLAEGEVFIIGGAQIYEQALPYVDSIYLTQIEADIDGDTYFPELNSAEWTQTAQEAHVADDKNQFDYTFITLERNL